MNKFSVAGFRRRFVEQYFVSVMRGLEQFAALLGIVICQTLYNVS